MYTYDFIGISNAQCYTLQRINIEIFLVGYNVNFHSFYYINKYKTMCSILLKSISKEQHTVKYLNTSLNISSFIVFMVWSLLSNALRPFWDLLCFPDLGIRTWICRLHFAQMPISSGLRLFNGPEISASWPLA